MLYIPLPAREVLQRCADGVSGATSIEELAAVMVEFGSLPRDTQTLPGLAAALAAPQGGEAIAADFFEKTLKSMAHHIRCLHDYFPSGVPVLEQGKGEVFSCSRLHALALISAAFLGLLDSKETEALQLPLRNFHQLLLNTTRVSAPKLFMILCYFHKELRSDASLAGSIYVRRVASDVEDPEQFFSTCERKLIPYKTVKSMEDQEDCLIADFANKFVGGGVLTYGDVQEEILFAKAPEHILATLVCPVMRPDEAVVITGASQYSIPQGYGRTLTFGTPYEGPQRKTLSELGLSGPDVDGNTIAFSSLAIDALHVKKLSTHSSSVFAFQLQKELILRECLKALAGFSADGPEIAYCRGGVSTGNWGCGAFGGNRQIKALIQWIASSAASREMRYASFGEADIEIALNGGLDLLHACAEKGLRVCDLFKALLAFGKIVNDLEAQGKPLPLSMQENPFTIVLLMALSGV